MGTHQLAVGKTNFSQSRDELLSVWGSFTFTTKFFHLRSSSRGGGSVQRSAIVSPNSTEKWRRLCRLTEFPAVSSVTQGGLVVEFMSLVYFLTFLSVCRLICKESSLMCCLYNSFNSLRSFVTICSCSSFSPMISRAARYLVSWVTVSTASACFL